MPGSGGMRLTGLTAFIDLEAEEEEESQTFMMQGSDSEMQTLVFMQESLFVLPESFDDHLLFEILPDSDNPDVIYVAGDLEDDVTLS